MSRVLSSFPISTPFIPPLELRDPSKNTGTTSPQVDSIPLFDSRLSKQYGNLAPYRIRQIRDDPTFSFLRETITSPAIHTPWIYTETKKAPSGAKQFIEEQLEEHRLWLLQNCFFGCIDFGWQPFEKVLAVNPEGYIVIEEYKQLLQDYTEILVYINSGRFAGLVNIPAGIDGQGKDVILPLQNSMICNFEVEGTDWYGRSITKVVDNIQTKWDNVDKAASRFDKKVAGSHWVLYYPVGQTLYNGVLTNNDEIAKKLLATLEASGTTAIPDEVQEWLDDEIDREMKGKWRLELLSDKGQAQQHFTDREKYLDNLKARAFGLPERSVFEGKFGTKAEADVHADIGVSNVDFKHRVVMRHVNLHAVNTLLALNFGQKAVGTVKAKVAPLVDSQFQVLKEVYRLIIQSPTLQELEANLIDTASLRQVLDIPSVPNAESLQAKLRKEMDEDREFKRQNMRDEAEARQDSLKDSNNTPTKSSESNNGDK